MFAPSVAKSLKDYYNASDDYLMRQKCSAKGSVRAYSSVLAKVAGSDSKVLDLGCGPGISTALVAEMGPWACGMDISLLFLMATGRKDLPFVQGDITSLPFATDSFDVVGLRATLEHVPEVETLVDEVIRVLRLGGWLVIFSPNLLSPFTPLRAVGNYLMRRTKIETPFYNSISSALLYSLEGFIRLTRKRLTRNASLEFRRPSLDQTGRDFDSVFMSNQVDMEKLLEAQGFELFNLAEGEGRIGRFLARMFPYYSGGIGITAEKRITSSGG